MKVIVASKNDEELVAAECLVMRCSKEIGARRLFRFGMISRFFRSVAYRLLLPLRLPFYVIATPFVSANDRFRMFSEWISARWPDYDFWQGLDAFILVYGIGAIFMLAVDPTVLGYWTSLATMCYLILLVAAAGIACLMDLLPSLATPLTPLDLTSQSDRPNHYVIQLLRLPTIVFALGIIGFVIATPTMLLYRHTIVFYFILAIPMIAVFCYLSWPSVAMRQVKHGFSEISNQNCFPMLSLTESRLEIISLVVNNDCSLVCPTSDAARRLMRRLKRDFVTENKMASPDFWTWWLLPAPSSPQELIVKIADYPRLTFDSE
jgi:hypothetical protein